MPAPGPARVNSAACDRCLQLLQGFHALHVVAVLLQEHSMMCVAGQQCATAKHSTTSRVGRCCTCRLRVLMLSWHRAARAEVAARAAALAEHRRQLREEQRRAKLAERFHRWAASRCCCLCCWWHTTVCAGRHPRAACKVLAPAVRRSKFDKLASGVRCLGVQCTCEVSCWGLLDGAISCSNQNLPYAIA